jgi:hypothetical protein
MRLRAPVAVVALLVAAGCSGRSDVTVPHDQDVEGGLEQARASVEPLYFAGMEFAGMPLTDVELQGAGRAIVAYGTCVIPAEQTEGGCSVPVQIQHFPFDEAMWRRAVSCTVQPTLLGVPTLRHDGLVLLTGRTVVKIYARGPAEDRRVALALRPVDAPDAPLRRLPPPAPGVRELAERVCS